MSKLDFLGAVVSMMLCTHAMAAEWAPIKRGEDTVREIDTTSIVKKGPQASFVARHTFADKNEYTVGRREVKYLLIASRANCDVRTLAQLATEAYDEKMGLISKQQIQLPDDSPVTAGSIDESELNFICAKGGQSQK